MVKRAESQMVDSAQILQEILKSAADERGEWPLPLPKKNVDSMRMAMDKNGDHINESLLATVYAYLKKASDDKMDGTQFVMGPTFPPWPPRVIQFTHQF